MFHRPFGELSGVTRAHRHASRRPEPLAKQGGCNGSRCAPGEVHPDRTEAYHPFREVTSGSVAVPAVAAPLPGSPDDFSDFHGGVPEYGYGRI
jgi:hypothetical protein